MRRCKSHPYWDSSAGVCAPCLRHRLLALAAAQNQQSAIPAPTSPDSSPLPFPSPYTAPRRRSDASPAFRNGGYAFFRTPQVGPAAAADDSAYHVSEGAGRSGKFSVIATLLGHSKSGKTTKSSTWLSSIFLRARRRNPSAASPPPAPARPSCRGMSPQNYSLDMDAEYNGSESYAQSPWRPTPSPMWKPSMPSVSGFAVCLSPLVRPRGGRAATETSSSALSGEIRQAIPTHHRRAVAGASAAALRHDRSMKLADVGRFR